MSSYDDRPSEIEPLRKGDKLPKVACPVCGRQVAARPLKAHPTDETPQRYKVIWHLSRQDPAGCPGRYHYVELEA